KRKAVQYGPPAPTVAQTREMILREVREAEAQAKALRKGEKQKGKLKIPGLGNKASGILIDGVLFVAGTVSAIELNKLQWRGPMGIKAAPIVFVTTAALAYLANKYKWKKTGKALKTFAIGQLAGIVADGIANKPAAV